MNLSDLGPQLREARQRSGLSQAELAGSLGMSRATVSAIERGRCDEIGVRKLAALLEMVGLELHVGPRRARPTLDELRAERRNEKERA